MRSFILDEDQRRLRDAGPPARVEERTIELPARPDWPQGAAALRGAAQDALRQARMMEAAGEITGGIAHHFNNLLQGITGSLDLLKLRLQLGNTDNAERLINGALAAARRGAGLTHGLLAFSGQQPLSPQPVRLNLLVVQMEGLVRRTMGACIRTELALAGGCWSTMCDPDQLEGAILNLCINAREAMPQGGTLVIEAANVSLDAAYGARENARAGHYVCVSVRDSGHGMAPDVLARVFEPFFTTKPVGQAAGLGLSVVYGFARQSSGHFKLYSESGCGTTAKLYLPRIDVERAVR